MRNRIEVAKLAKRTNPNDAWTPQCEAKRVNSKAFQSAVDGPLTYPNFSVSSPSRLMLQSMNPGGVGVTLEQSRTTGRAHQVAVQVGCFTFGRMGSRIRLADHLLGAQPAVQACPRDR